MNNLHDIKYNELIGRTMKIISSTESSLDGIGGIVINETKNTFHLLHNGRKKIIPKSNCVFTFSNNSYSISGNELIGQPQNRLSKVRRL